MIIHGVEQRHGGTVGVEELFNAFKHSEFITEFLYTWRAGRMGEKLNVFLRINHIHNLISQSIFFGDKLVRLLYLKSSPVRKLNSKNLSFRCEPISRCKKYILQLNQYEEHSCSHLVCHGWKALTYS